MSSIRKFILNLRDKSPLINGLIAEFNVELGTHYGEDYIVHFNNKGLMTYINNNHDYPNHPKKLRHIIKSEQTAY